MEKEARVSSLSKLRVVHYINQYFGQQGGEDAAGMGFLVQEAAVGPGRLLEKILGESGAVVATLICGDNYFSENLSSAAEEGLALIEPYKPDLFLAGPAFNAGRYGVACGAICKMVGEKLGIPAVTGMFQGNPGVELYRRDVYICDTGNNVARMQESLQRMTNLGLKLARGEQNRRLLCRRGEEDLVRTAISREACSRMSTLTKTQQNEAWTCCWRN